MDRAQRKVNWLEFARQYAAMKWPSLAPNSRRNTARALTNAALAMISDDRGRPDDAELRNALTAWAFNPRGRAPAELPRTTWRRPSCGWNGTPATSGTSTMPRSRAGEAE